jgi:thiazole tautomerase (transcriptional regulator TenI)
MIRWPVPCVYLVTDRRRLAPDARTADAELRVLEAFLDDALDAGVDAIQIRERDLAAGLTRGLAARLAVRADGRAVILVNDRVDIALASGAGGVHLRADSAATDAVRAIVPAGWTIGRSAHSPEEAGGELSADYVLFGTVFPSASKPGAEGAGLAPLQEAAAACHAPVIAIGGMTPERAAQARAAGAAGVAAIGVFLPPGRHPSGLGVRTAVRALRTSMQPG